MEQPDAKRAAGVESDGPQMHSSDAVHPDRTPAVDHLTVALKTAAGGFPVFPCKANKAPATRSGFKDATLEPERITKCWTARPDLLVGTPTEGLVVVDLDQHPDLDTWEWWQVVCAEHGHPWWDDLIVATAGGGYHIYFEAPEGSDVRNSVSQLAPGVDIRANGGYVIAPGSTLRDGRSYDVANLPERMAVAPDWLVEMCVKHPERPAAPEQQGGWDADLIPDVGHGSSGGGYGSTALARELDGLSKTPVGQRNHELNRSAFRMGQLVAADKLESDEAVDGLTTTALAMGLTESETIKTVGSGLRKGIENPRASLP